VGAIARLVEYRRVRYFSWRFRRNSETRAEHELNARSMTNNSSEPARKHGTSDFPCLTSPTLRLSNSSILIPELNGRKNCLSPSKLHPMTTRLPCRKLAGRLRNLERESVEPSVLESSHSQTADTGCITVRSCLDLDFLQVRLPNPNGNPSQPRFRMLYEACDGTAPNQRGVWRIAIAVSK